MSHQKTPIALQVPEQITGPLNPIMKTLGSASGVLNAFPKLALHMMVTFYLMLIIMAILVDSESPPSLMAFVLYWHCFAVLTLGIPSLIFWLCKSPLGMLACLTVVFLLILILHDNFANALETIESWLKFALREF